MEGNNTFTRTIAKGEPEGLTFRLIKSKILQNWRWFAGFSLAGLLIAFVYYKMTPPYYKISSTILIKADGKNAELNNVFRELNPTKSNPIIQDQVGVLKSYNLNFRTLQYMNWRYSWFRQEWMMQKDLYGNDPFEIVLADESIQLDNVPISVKLLSDDEVLIDCDAVAKINGSDINVHFEQTVELGEVFKNDYFHFSLKKKPDHAIEVGDKFVLVFNNLNQMALKYKESLQIRAANPLTNSNLIVVELVTNHLQRDVDYLNQLGRVYLQFGLDEKNRIANNTIKFIDDQITGVDQSLQVAGDQFSSFRARNRTVDLGQEASAVVEKLKQIEVERSNLQLKLEYYNNLKFYLQNRDENKDLVAPSLVGVTDDALNQRVLQLNELYTRREVLSYTAQERNPVLISLNNQIEYAQKSLQENVDNLLANTNVEIQNLNERQRSVNYELSKLPKTEQDLIGIKRNFDLNNELYTFLLQRRAEAEIAKASNNPDAQILDPTDTEIAVRIGPLLTINLLIGLFGGLFFALGVVVFKELIEEVITDIEDIISKLDISIVGSIGINKFKTEIPVLRYPRASLTESFRGLKVNLEFMLGRDRGQVLAVHSYTSGEGKSFVAVNLSLIFAMSGKKVLLIDGDMRKSRIHKLLNAENKVGLASYLRGGFSPSQIVITTKIPNLDFVSAGEGSEGASESLRRESVGELLDVYRKEYDLIVVDNAPFGIVYDPFVIGTNADFNLILLRINYSKKTHIDIINKLGREGLIKKIMVAVNGVKQSQGHGYYTDEANESHAVTGPASPAKEGLKKSAAVFATGAASTFESLKVRFNWNKD